MGIQTKDQWSEITDAQFSAFVLPLDTGDRLSRAEFERRYKAHPEIKKAELIEGVVYVGSPVRFQQHGRPHHNIVTWTGVYQAATPGVLGGDNTTVRLDDKNEPQPDVFLCLDPSLGGQSQLSADDYIEGSPELIVEIAASSESLDLTTKHRVYARCNVQEYLVAQVRRQQFHWFVLREGIYQPLSPDENGILRSEVFPGLWLQPAAFWTGDLATMLAVLQEGLVSPEHTDFAARLRAANAHE